MAEFPIPEGYELLVGLTKENARQALAEAVENGFGPETVLTRHDGFLIPLPEGYEPEGEEDEEDEPDPTPDKTWKNDDIVEWAGKQEPAIDLGEATVKADMLAVIDTELAARAAAGDHEEEVE